MKKFYFIFKFLFALALTFTLAAPAAQAQCPNTGIAFFPLDVKPGSCPNPININSCGVLPVAVLGTHVLDVYDIDPVTVKLNGVSPIRSSYEDVATPSTSYPYTSAAELTCVTWGPDSYTDLVLKFDKQKIAETLCDCVGKEIVVSLTGNLKDGTCIKGWDIVLVQDKQDNSCQKNKKNKNKNKNKNKKNKKNKKHNNGGIE